MTMTEPKHTETGLAQILDRLPAEREARVAFLHKLLGEGACRQVGIFPLPPGFKLSVVIPVYNEERWLAELVRRVQVVPIPKELILINDMSTDGTPAILKQLVKHPLTDRGLEAFLADWAKTGQKIG